MEGSMDQNIENELRIVGNKDSKYVVYTGDGSEFYLDEFNEFNASGRIDGDFIKFHPENIIAVRSKSKSSSH